MCNYILYRIGEYIALHLPLRFSYALSILISDIKCLFTPQDRKAVLGNLRAIFPEKNDTELCRVRKRIYRNFAKYLVDFFRFDTLTLAYIKKNIRIENIHNFNEALAKKKGVIALTAHLGNWELGGVVISLLGYHFSVVALAHKDPLVDKFFNTKRESKGLKVIALGKAVKKSLDVLKSNKMLALVGDRDFTEKGVIVDFFGKPTIFPKGPAALALKTGASIVPGFMLRNDDDSFTLRIEKPLAVETSGSREEDERRIIAIYKGIFEDYIRHYPDQWYMFRRFWV